jgi:periplasmic protein TonB
MGALKQPRYESLDTEVPVECDEGSKTRTGSVKHNTVMGLIPAMPRPAQAREVEPANTMANQLLTQTDAETGSGARGPEGHELDALLGKAFDEKPIWSGLYESIRDVFFPPKLPPLELTSTPIPVPDRMAVKANPWAIGISSTLNLAILALLLFFGVRQVIKTVTQTDITPIDVGAFKAPMEAKMAGGGGGGGDNSILQASKGKLPKQDLKPIVPPQVQTFDKPKIPVPPTLDVQNNLQLPDNPNMPNLGMKSSVNVVLSSNGTGSAGGIGTGEHGGIGSGNGDGFGPGSDGNAGGGVYQIGGGVSAPQALNSVEAEFSDEARRAKYQGVVLISMIVDANGMPQNPRVVRPLGMGLDEKALEAVRKYRFKPAMKDGKTPVPVMITVEVNFRLY